MIVAVTGIEPFPTIPADWLTKGIPLHAFVPLVAVRHHGKSVFWNYEESVIGDDVLERYGISTKNIPIVKPDKGILDDKSFMKWKKKQKGRKTNVSKQKQNQINQRNKLMGKF